MALQELLVLIIVVGFGATGLAALIKVTPIWPKTWHETKPLGCVACMAGHATWAVLALAVLANHYTVPMVTVLPGFAQLGLAWLGGTGLATFLLGQSGLFMPPLPPSLPSLEETIIFPEEQ